MNTFKVNGKTYTAKPFDFNLVCDLDDMGISMETFGERPMSLLRAYFSVCAKISLEDAGNEIGKQMVADKNGLDGLANAMAKEIENSDFFQALTQNENTETPKPQKKTTKQ